MSQQDMQDTTFSRRQNTINKSIMTTKISKVSSKILQRNGSNIKHTSRTTVEENKLSATQFNYKENYMIEKQMA